MVLNRMPLITDVSFLCFFLAISIRLLSSGQISMTSSYAEKFLLKNLINLNMALVNVVSAGIELQMH